MRKHFDTALGLAFVALLLLHIGNNVRLFIRNDAPDNYYRLALRDTPSLHDATLGHPHPWVRDTLEVYYLLATHARGAEVTIPPQMRIEPWYLTHVSGLHWRIGEAALRPEVAAALDGLAPLARRYLEQEVYLRFAPGVGHYTVVAAGEHGPFYWLPAHEVSP